MKESKRIKILKIFAFIITPILGAAFIIGTFSDGIWSAIRYTKVHDKGIVVEAVVTDHGKDYDEHDYDYVSYISYTVNGVDYENIKYETKDREEELDPIGTTVTIEINPENPEESLSDIWYYAFSELVLWPAMWILGLVTLIKVKAVHSKEITVESVDKQSIEKCFMITLRRRIMRTYCFILTMYYLLLCFVFPIVFDKIIIIIIPAVAYLAFLVKDIYELVLIKQSIYQIYNGTFAEKFETTQNGDTYYWVSYYFEELKESKSLIVSYDDYQLANENDCCYMVFFPDEININDPVFTFYGINGKFVMINKYD